MLLRTASTLWMRRLKVGLSLGSLLQHSAIICSICNNDNSDLYYFTCYRCNPWFEVCNILNKKQWHWAVTFQIAAPAFSSELWHTPFCHRKHCLQITHTHNTLHYKYPVLWLCALVLCWAMFHQYKSHERRQTLHPGPSTLPLFHWPPLDSCQAQVACSHFSASPPGGRRSSGLVSRCPSSPWTPGLHQQAVSAATQQAGVFQEFADRRLSESEQLQNSCPYFGSVCTNINILSLQRMHGVFALQCNQIRPILSTL